MAELRVDLYGTVVGNISGERDRFDFTASRDGLERFGVASSILSVAVPLVRYRGRRAADPAPRRAFFEELLAEGGARRTLAANARLDTDNTVGLLARYGRDTAGALQISDESDPAEPRTPEAKPVSAAEIARMFREVATAPLGNSGRRRVSSLAGVQDKVLLVRLTDGGWAEPLDGWPSTHILKPLNTRTPSLIFDEEYGSRLVHAVGLATFATAIESFDGTNALVVERFDRDADGARIHQEDFNQALSLIGDRKYEDPTETDRLRRIAAVLSTHSGDRDLHRLLRMTTLSVLIRNFDMHAKNIALLHTEDGGVHLAPMYDVIPSGHLEVDPEFALAVNGRRHVDQVTLADVIAEGRSWGIRHPDQIVLEVAEQVVHAARTEQPHPGAHGGLDAAVEHAATSLLDGHAGASTRVRDVTSAGRGTASCADDDRSGGAAPLKQNPGGWGGPVG